MTALTLLTAAVLLSFSVYITYRLAQFSTGLYKCEESYLKEKEQKFYKATQKLNHFQSNFLVKISEVLDLYYDRLTKVLNKHTHSFFTHTLGSGSILKKSVRILPMMMYVYIITVASHIYTGGELIEIIFYQHLFLVIYYLSKNREIATWLYRVSNFIVISVFVTTAVIASGWFIMASSIADALGWEGGSYLSLLSYIGLFIVEGIIFYITYQINARFFIPREEKEDTTVTLRKVLVLFVLYCTISLLPISIVEYISPANLDDSSTLNFIGVYIALIGILNCATTAPMMAAFIIFITFWPFMAGSNLCSRAIYKINDKGFYVYTTSLLSKTGIVSIWIAWGAAAVYIQSNDTIDIVGLLSSFTQGK